MKTELGTALLSLACVFSGAAISTAQDGPAITIREMVMMSGTIESVSVGKLVVRDQTGKAQTIRVHGVGQKAVSLANGQRLNYPAEVRVVGQLPMGSLKAGQLLSFRGQLNRLGKANGKVAAIDLVTNKDITSRLQVLRTGEGSTAYSTCEIIGAFVRTINGRVIVNIPKDNGFTRKTTLSFPVADNLLVNFNSNDIGRATAGAKVIKLVAARLNTGDLVAKTLDVQVSTKNIRRPNAGDKLLAKYRHLSDKPQSPREIRSRHFRFITDISDRQAQIILDKLETMVSLLSSYFGRRPTGVVNGYIVRDLNNGWQGKLIGPKDQLAAGVAKIRARAGICFNLSLGSQRQAVLYSCDDHGVIQHECTHGFCHMVFGSTGPTWLAEGVAELGQYWKKGQLEVDINPSVLTYLQRARPKRSLLEIAVPGRTPPGGWQDYAWRWALCHLLSNNPNYSSRFKPLAIALMEKRPGVTFAAVYGPMANEITFEYDQFLHNLTNGYRPDLCAWDWKTKFKPLTAQRPVTTIRIKAAAGWQASGLQLETGVSYTVKTVGQWKIAPGTIAYDGNGDNDGRGSLLGAIMTTSSTGRYTLSSGLPFRSETSFTAPVDGKLFLRCRDDWGMLHDNDGEISVHLSRSNK